MLEQANEIKINEAKLLEIISRVNQTNYKDGCLKDGMYGLYASSKTLFGLDFDKHPLNLSSNPVIEILFRELMALEIPPTMVTLTAYEGIKLCWCANYKVAITDNTEYIKLLIQFQNYIDEIKFLDLKIDFSELNKPTDVEYGEGADEPAPVEFISECFYDYDYGKIGIKDEINGTYYEVEYDSDGKVFFMPDENDSVDEEY